MGKFQVWLRRSPTTVVVAGAVGSLALALSTNSTLAAFTAQITNSDNTAATGMIAMRETLLDASGQATATVCNSNDGTPASVTANAATCATINKYGGTASPLRPGGEANVTKISITNTGTVAATTFVWQPGTCTPTAQAIHGSAALSGVCAKFIITITSGSTQIWSGNAASVPTSLDLLAKLGNSSVAPNESIPLTISVALDASADNSYGGFTISQPMTWRFTS